MASNSGIEQDPSQGPSSSATSSTSMSTSTTTTTTTTPKSTSKTTTSSSSSSSPYPIPKGLHAIPLEQLDLRPDAEIDETLLDPPPVRGEKNIWLFWHSGYRSMPEYSKRNIRGWHRRFSRQGWTVRVLHRSPAPGESPQLHISRFLPLDDPATFPLAFRNGTLTGAYAAQHASDLIRLPLLLRHGGVYVDVGFIQLGDLDRLWHATVADPSTPWELLTYNTGDPTDPGLTNYFLAASRANPLLDRSHRLLLALWTDRLSTDGMHASPLLHGVPLMASRPSDHLSFDENGHHYPPAAVSRLLTDYIIQGQAIKLVMGLLDPSDNWDGPGYTRTHIYALDFLVGAQLINHFTAWDGRRAFELLSLPLPGSGETETAQQAAAREIVEGCLTRSFGFKLATGLILRVLGPTLSSLWRENPGSDDVVGTYAHWLRFGAVYWNQDAVPGNVPFGGFEPYRVGGLLGDEEGEG